jgi:hypothetical protein
MPDRVAIPAQHLYQSGRNISINPAVVKQFPQTARRFFLHDR